MTTKKIKKRLEYLRKELRAERISQGELCELQSLARHIDPGDVELLEPAGVPEQTNNGNLHCPDCGKHSLRLIETTDKDGSDEYKEVRTCDHCENMVYIVRQG